jgi:hypothetical protein
MPSRRATIIGVSTAFAVGLVILVAGALATKSRVVENVGVIPLYPVAPIAKGQEACQAPIGLADDVDRVRFNVGVFGKPGVPLEVTIRAAGTAIVLGRGHVAGGWLDVGKPREVSVGHIEANQRVAACVRNLGTRRAFVYGDLYGGTVVPIGPLGLRPTPSNTSAQIDGVDIPGDIAVSFVSAKPRSLLTRLPGVFRHAAVFRPAFVGSWTFWLLFLVAVFAVPAALLVALLRSDRAADPPGPQAPAPESPRGVEAETEGDATLSHR